MRYLSLLVIAVLLCVPAFGAAYTSTQSGSWNSAATWGGAGVPSISGGDTVTVSTGNTVTWSNQTLTACGSSTVACVSITINGTLYITNNRFLSSGDVIILNVAAAGNLYVDRVDWRMCADTTYCGKFGGTAATTGVRLLTNITAYNTTQKMFNISGPDYKVGQSVLQGDPADVAGLIFYNTEWEMTGSPLRLNIASSFEIVDAFQQAVAFAGNLGATIQDSIFYMKFNNPHYIGANNNRGQANNIYTRNLCDGSNSNGGVGDSGDFEQSDNATISNNILFNGCGTIWTAHAGVTETIKNNTSYRNFGGSNGEGSGDGSILAVFRNNLIVNPVVPISAEENGLFQLTSFVSQTGLSLDYNGFWQMPGSGDSGAPALNTPPNLLNAALGGIRSYVGAESTAPWIAGSTYGTTAGFGTHDIHADPQFAGCTSGGTTSADNCTLAKWDTNNGGAGTIASVAAQVVKLNGYDSAGAATVFNPNYSIQNALRYIRQGMTPQNQTYNYGAGSPTDGSPYIGALPPPANCTQPTILPSLASPTVTLTFNTPADGDVTFTYDTDVASDTACFIANDGNGTPDQYDFPKGIGQWWNTTGASDLTGVTHHVCTLHGMRPGWTYAYNVRSRCIVNGVPALDQTKLRFAYDIYGGQTSGWSPTFTTPSIITTDPATYDYRTNGGTKIYNGASGQNGLIVGWRVVPLSGNDTSITATFSGLPACMTRQFIGYTGQFASGNVITTSPTNARDHGFNVRLTASSCVPGNYTLTESYTFSPSGVTGSSNYTVTVADLPPFAAATPIAFPDIPCWKHGSVMQDGSTPCAQTFEDTLLTTEAAFWAGTGIGGTVGGGCSLASSPAFTISSNGDQWPEYYDGARVYNQFADYKTLFPSSTTNALSLYTQAAQDCGNAYYSSGATLSYVIAGRWIFGEGAVQNFQRYGLTAASTFLNGFQNTGSSYFPPNTNPQFNYNWEMLDNISLREIVYGCNWVLQLHRFDGRDEATNLQWCTDELLGFIDQIVNRTGSLEQGFYNGLLADTLIEIYSDPYTGADPRIPVALQILAAQMNDPTQRIWQPNAQNPHAWCLNCRKTDLGLGAGDNSMLNMMAVQVEGWLWKHTNATFLQTFGDYAYQYGILGYGRNHGKELSSNTRMLPQYFYDRTNSGISIPSSIRLGQGVRIRGARGVIIR